MKTNITKLLVAFVILNAPVLFLDAQNLIPNNGFETNSGLPSGPGMYSLATGWQNCSGSGSPDYMHMNGSGIVQLPNCFPAMLYPLSGNAIMGFCPYYPVSNPNFREYLDAQLTTPLTAGNVYNVSFHITNGICSGAYGGYGIDQVGVYFSNGALTQIGSGVINVTPQVTVPGILYDTAWHTVNLQFTATAAFDHITFGNFKNDAATNSAQFAVASSMLAYYFLDDVTVALASTVFANTCVGDSTTFQNNASLGTIATSWDFGDTLSGLNNVAYTTNALHQFSGPGTYIVTTINFQPSGINDTLHTTVVINPTPVVNLGNDTTLCPGQTLTLIADTGYTSYQWSNGNTTNNILVANAGMYSIIISNNGCTAMDSILISNTICAPTIALASSDTLFCEKQCIDFFDFTTNNPTSWQWTFQGASPDTSTAQNPTGICYNSYGSFTVTLVACNAFGCDSVTYTNFINEFQNPVDSIWGFNDTLWSLPFSAYQWYLVGNGAIAGATNQYYVPTQLGNYYCVADDSIGCVATSNTISLTAVQSVISNSQFAILPNPNNGNFEIVFDEMNNSLFGAKCTFRIFNTLGEVVFQNGINDKTSGSKTEIKLILTDGIYFIELNTNGKTLHQKFILKK